jgi:hypothetical protein
MILHLGERVFWGASEVIYLEGTITQLDETTQTVLVHIDRTTPNSAHLIGSDIPFAADGVTPLKGDSPPGTTNERSTQRQSAESMSDEEKIRCAAAVAVHQKYGYSLTPEQEHAMIEQVAQVLDSDQEMRTRIITSMNEILLREQK